MSRAVPEPCLFPGGIEPQPPAADPPMVQWLTSFYAWVLSGGCKIRDKKGRIIALKPNQAQIDTHKAMLLQAMQRKAVRLIRLKSRKVGVSTWMQALFYYLTKHVPHMNATTIAHSREANGEIFRITKLIHHRDETALPTERGNRRELAYPISHGSLFKTESAGGEYIGSGSTNFFVHVSEMSKWPAATLQDQMTSVLNSVPDEAETIIVIESTANQTDPTGEFERMWKQAEAGESGYLAVFTAWFADPEARIAGAAIERKTEYETTLVERFGLDDEQIAWLRWVLANKCGGREHVRRQEYPSTPDEAFSSAAGKVFPMLTRAKHDLHLPLDDLRKGWELYRGVDWGGGHPFVCVWIAHRRGPSRFTCDVMRCMATWDQLVRWTRMANRKLHPLNDDAIDAIRYVVTTYGLTGHVHVYRELFIPNSAQMGLSEVDLGKRIVDETGSEKVLATVADRSRPNSIVLFNQHGIPCSAAVRPETTHEGEVEDGVAVLFALMSNTANLAPPEKPIDPMDELIRIWSERDGDYGHTDETLALAIRRRMGDGAGVLHPFLGMCD